MPDAELVVEGAGLRPLAGDEALFARHEFRTTRYQAVIPRCEVRGLDYGGLLQGKSYRASSVDLTQPSFEAQVNREKPVKPFVKSPLMVHEALASIGLPLQVDSLRLTKGRLRYCERVRTGGDPAVLTFGAVSAVVEGIANRGTATTALRVRAQGDLMDAGTLKVLMVIPVAPPDFARHYSGSLTAMDLIRLDAFLETAEHVRIKSGSAHAASFEIDVAGGQARGQVRASYQDLGIAVLDDQTGTEAGLGNRLSSFLANVLKVRNANGPDASGTMKEGQVDYLRRPEDTFQEFVWSALWTGVRDVITH